MPEPGFHAELILRAKKIKEAVPAALAQRESTFLEVFQEEMDIYGSGPASFTKHNFGKFMSRLRCSTISPKDRNDYARLMGSFYAGISRKSMDGVATHTTPKDFLKAILTVAIEAAKFQVNYDYDVEFYHHGAKSDMDYCDKWLERRFEKGKYIEFLDVIQGTLISFTTNEVFVKRCWELYESVPENMFARYLSKTRVILALLVVFAQHYANQDGSPIKNRMIPIYTLFSHFVNCLRHIPNTYLELGTFNDRRLLETVRPDDIETMIMLRDDIESPEDLARVEQICFHNARYDANSFLIQKEKWLFTLRDNCMKLGLRGLRPILQLVNGQVVAKTPDPYVLMSSLCNRREVPLAFQGLPRSRLGPMRAIMCDIISPSLKYKWQKIDADMSLLRSSGEIFTIVTRMLQDNDTVLSGGSALAFIKGKMGVTDLDFYTSKTMEETESIMDDLGFKIIFKTLRGEHSYGTLKLARFVRKDHVSVVVPEEPRPLFDNKKGPVNCSDAYLIRPEMMPKFHVSALNEFVNEVVLGPDNEPYIHLDFCQILDAANISTERDPEMPSEEGSVFQSIDVIFCPKYMSDDVPVTPDKRPLKFIAEEFDLSIIKNVIRGPTLEVLSLYPEHVASNQFTMSFDRSMSINTAKAATICQRVRKYINKGYAFMPEKSSKMIIRHKSVFALSSRPLKRLAREFADCRRGGLAVKTSRNTTYEHPVEDKFIRAHNSDRSFNPHALYMLHFLTLIYDRVLWARRFNIWGPCQLFMSPTSVADPSRLIDGMTDYFLMNQLVMPLENMDRLLLSALSNRDTHLQRAVNHIRDCEKVKIHHTCRGHIYYNDGNSEDYIQYK